MDPTSIDPGIRRRLQRHIDNLPVLPLALVNLLALDPESDDYFDDVIGILESEPNFAARLLVAANSAYSSPARPIVTLPAAVTRIGSRGATDLVLALSVVKVFVPRDPWERGLWRHGVQVAHAARALAREARGGGLNPDEAYTCALLHDVGRFVFFQEAPDKLRAVDEGDWSTPQALVEEERVICGLTHPEVGAMACDRWGLPEIIGNIVRRHHDPLPDDFSQPEDRMLAIVQLADLAMFQSVLTGTHGPEEPPDPTVLAADLRPRLPPFLPLSVDKLTEIIEQAEREADQASEALGIVG